ncbi:unnamed protein product [Symbiodinium natans]|uniref:Uncharacterized protein n=1 Tax=Symbiodinium natans TaxID=878477 RepID=A0A812PVS9_9DINO|nr:unnamed protein product [Symbiodinium natans]
MRIAYRFTFLQFHEDESEDEDDAAQGRAHSAPPRLGFTAEITPAIGPGSAGVGAFANLQDAEGGDGGTPFAAVGDGGAAVASVPQDCDDTSSSDEEPANKCNQHSEGSAGHPVQDSPTLTRSSTSLSGSGRSSRGMLLGLIPVAQPRRDLPPAPKASRPAPRPCRGGCGICCTI